MKIYLDNCAIQRPLDSRTQLRIILEIEAIRGIVGLCESGQLELVTSQVLLYEIYRNQNEIRKQFALKVLSKGVEYVEMTDQVSGRARILTEAGFKPIDALHLASAEEAGVDYFCTCDDRLRRRGKAYQELRIEVVSPIDLILEIDK